MIYFDNAATTFPKPKSVIESVRKCISEYSANAGRSSHRLALKMSDRIYEARELVAAFFGCDRPENVIFTQNATYALNIAIKSSLEYNNHVITSDIEHNALLRPIYSLSESSFISYSKFNSKKDTGEEIKALKRENTSYIISTLASNVTGYEIPIESLSQASQENNLSLILDASQLAGHRAINISKYRPNVLCAPGHKALFGIQGVGIIIFCDSKERKTVIEGGSGSESKSHTMPLYLPERFEAGTLPGPAIVSLISGIEYINGYGIDNVERRLCELTARAKDAVSSIRSTKTLGDKNGILSFNLSDIPSSVISEELDRDGICTRSGLHCAPDAHKALGTELQGAVRVSFSIFNTEEEIDALFRSLKRIRNKYL